MIPILRKGLCTTYLAAVLMERLSLWEIRGLPKLIRLNPCAQFKTRGNAALAFELRQSVQRGQGDWPSDVSGALRPFGREHQPWAGDSR